MRAGQQAKPEEATPAMPLPGGGLIARAFEEADARLFPDRDAADVVPGDLTRLLPPDARPHDLI